MDVIITADDAMNKGIWSDICEIKGYNEWAVNEGLMDSDHEIRLTCKQAKTLGLIKGD